LSTSGGRNKHILTKVRNPLCQDSTSAPMRLFTFSTALALSILAAASVSAQVNDEKQEFAVTIGEMSGSTPNVSGIPLTLGSGVGLEANFARKFRTVKYGSLFWEVDALGSPLRYLSVAPNSHAVRSFFAAPGLKWQFSPGPAWSPWMAVGAGYAFYDANSAASAVAVATIGPVPPSGTVVTSTSLKTNTYAADFGGGVDYVVRPHFVIRGEARGYYTGGPKFGLGSTSGELNFIIGGGIVWRFTK